MKCIFVAVVVVVFAISFANAECDEKSKKALNECYKKFMKTVDLESPVVNKKFCKFLTEHQDCLKENAKDCQGISDDEIAKVFGSDKTDVQKLLFMELSYQYVCNHKHIGTEEEDKCIAEISPEEFGCKTPANCHEMKDNIACLKEAMTKNAKMKNFQKYILMQHYLDLNKYFQSVNEKDEDNFLT